RPGRPPEGSPGWPPAPGSPRAAAPGCRPSCGPCRRWPGLPGSGRTVGARGGAVCSWGDRGVSDGERDGAPGDDRTPRLTLSSKNGAGKVKRRENRTYRHQKKTRLNLPPRNSQLEFGTPKPPPVRSLEAGVWLRPHQNSSAPPEWSVSRRSTAVSDD